MFLDDDGPAKNVGSRSRQTEQQTQHKRVHWRVGMIAEGKHRDSFSTARGRVILRDRMNRMRWPCPCILTVTLVLCGAAQQPSGSPSDQSWRGAWAASNGPRTFHGRWWAQLPGRSRNAASGSWTLLSDANQIVLEGTWSARKSLTGWQGTWTARPNSGQAFSGTWSSDMSDGKTFEDMLNKTLGKQVTGSWRRGRMQGNWWLMGPGY